MKSAEYPQELKENVETLQALSENPEEKLNKDNIITKLEAENSSYKSEISDLETSHSTIIAEYERKLSQCSEENALKIKDLETERDQLTAKILSKNKVITKLEGDLKSEYYRVLRDNIWYSVIIFLLFIVGVILIIGALTYYGICVLDIIKLGIIITGKMKNTQNYEKELALLKKKFQKLLQVPKVHVSL